MIYRSELVQVAASCLAAAQVEEIDTTCLMPNAEGMRGRLALHRLVDEVMQERHLQEMKWGTHHNEDAAPDFWLLVILEEIGEVAEEIRASSKTGGPLLAAAIELGAKARTLLEMR